MTCVFDGDFEAIPENIKTGIVNYVEYNLPPGGFLTAMIRGDLFECVRRADRDSRRNIPLIALWLEQNVPGLCGPANMNEHLSRRTYK
jgi:hypothetical protein